MSILSHKKFDTENYQVPDHVKPSDAARECDTRFNISDVRYFKQEPLHKDEKGYMHGEMWMDTNYTYDGHPISVWHDIGQDGIIASELYIDTSDDELLTNADKYGKDSFPNFETYIARKYGEEKSLSDVSVVNDKGESISGSELIGLAREYGMLNINKPHVMSFKEYSDWRELNVERMGPYKDYDYNEYINSALEDVNVNRTEYIGKYKKDFEQLYLDDPAAFAEYYAWADERDAEFQDSMSEEYDG